MIELEPCVLLAPMDRASSWEKVPPGVAVCMSRSLAKKMGAEGREWVIHGDSLRLRSVVIKVEELRDRMNILRQRTTLRVVY
jgi:hypothetical protein